MPILLNGNELCITVDTDSPFCKQGRTLANNIMNKLNGIPASEMKEIMFPLQGPNLWHKWAKLNKKQNRMKWKDSGFLGVESFNTEMRPKKEIVCKYQLEKAKKISLL